MSDIEIEVLGEDCDYYQECILESQRYAESFFVN